jgi:integrase
MGRTRTGSICLKDDVIYARVRWTDDEGKRKEKIKRANNKTHARQLIQKMLREIDDYGTRFMEFEEVKFEQLADYYKKHHTKPAQFVQGRKISGRRSLHTHKYIIPIFTEHFGSKKLRSITHADLSRFRVERLNTPTRHETQRSIATVNRELEVLRNMFNIAMREGWILKNPFNSGPPLIQTAHEKMRERIITVEEEKQMLAACTGRREHLKALIICALDTGMRRGEILSLVWDDIDFENKLLHIKAFNTKTERERWLAPTPRLLAQLAMLYEKSDKNSDSRVFGIKDNFKRSFDYVRQLVGLPEVRFHDLRHTAATRLVQKDVPLPLVGRILGHTLANTTMRYVNANIETARIAAEALASFTDTENKSDSETIIH